MTDTTKLAPQMAIVDLAEDPHEWEPGPGETILVHRSGAEPLRMGVSARVADRLRAAGAEVVMGLPVVCLWGIRTSTGTVWATSVDRALDLVESDDRR